MRRFAAIVVTLALFTIPVASTHVAGAEPAKHTQNQKPETITVKTVADVTPSTTSTTPTPAPSPASVTVQPGDTLTGIATVHNTTAQRLYDANSFIANPDLIYPGQQLTIPDSVAQLVDRTASVPAPTVVTIKSGDTLGSIAATNGTTVQRLYDANPSISNPNVIDTGEQVTVPTSGAQLVDRAMPTVTPAATRTTTVRTATVPTTTAVTQPATVHTTAAPAAAVAPAVTHTATTGIPNSAAKAYIYAHESSNNPSAINAQGCYGLGQDCSGKVRQLCGANYACQDAFFDSYAASRYGGWANALAFWQSHHWW